MPQRLRVPYACHVVLMKAFVQEFPKINVLDCTGDEHLENGKTKNGGK